MTQYEEVTPDSASEQNATSAFIAMVACKVILLLMMAACSPQARADIVVATAAAYRVDTSPPASADVIAMERIEVTASAEDAPPRARNRWQAFNDVLNANGRRGYRVIEARSNDGARTRCYEPCVVGCCTSSGGFSLATAGFRH